MELVRNLKTPALLAAWFVFVSALALVFAIVGFLFVFANAAAEDVGLALFLGSALLLLLWLTALFIGFPVIAGRPFDEFFVVYPWLKYAIAGALVLIMIVAFIALMGWI